MKPVSSYADVNGINLYHEIYGEGEPLVLIHGGLTTISEMQGWVQPLAQTRQVIAVEMQGHCRTADPRVDLLRDCRRRSATKAAAPSPNRERQSEVVV